MHQEGSSNSMPLLDFTSLSPLDNEIEPQTLEISSINHLLQQSTKLSSPIEKIISSTFEESDLIVGDESDLVVRETFSNEEEVFLPRKEGKRCSEIKSRWAEQETLALLKFRSEMDAAFQDVILRGHFWEDISRKLKELGYNRSAKQCEEKFASIQRHHKRTKEGRAGGASKKDLKSCSSSGQLEALHRTNATSTFVSSATTPFAAPIETNTIISSSSAGGNQPSPIFTVTPPSIVAPSLVSTNPTEISNAATAIANAAGITLSSTFLCSESDDGKAEGTRRQGQKRKRGQGSRTWKTMMAFFEELTRKVLERQDAMQQKLLEAIEKGDRERMVKEEAWRRQEMARLARERELIAQERAAVASRYKDLTTIFQNIAGHTIPMPPLSTNTAGPTPQPSSPPQQQQHSPQQQPSSDTELAIVSLPETQEMVTEDTTKNSRSTTSRWPKAEVQELIKLRTSLEPLHQGGPKGPLWEKVSVGMQQLGYDRSAKKCKEKWENINKYFKRVRDRYGRVENSRNCPYFHQLDAFHRSRSSGQSSHMLQGGGASGSALGAMSPPQLQQAAGGTANDNNGHEENFEGDVGFGKDVAKKFMEQSFQAMTDDGDKLEDPDNENMAQEGEDENEETEDE